MDQHLQTTLILQEVSVQPWGPESELNALGQACLDSHSTSGYVFNQAGGPISWAGKRQTTSSRVQTQNTMLIQIMSSYTIIFFDGK